MDCIFCKIANGDILSNKVYEDEDIFAFYDLEPQAPVHFLIVPKKHISSISEIDSTNSGIVAHVFEKIPQIAKELGLIDGYRVVVNNGRDGGQSVPHLHFHVLGGRSLSWPPG